MSNFDEALERFHLVDLEYAGGLSSHGPMAAEALECLGHQALIPAFLDLYIPRLPPAAQGTAMSAEEARSALGQIGRAADWVATFESRLSEGDWQTVLSEALPGLMPGVFAGAGHGFLRTTHAVRSLEREDSPLHRRELARGLAYWSARFQILPGRPGAQSEKGATLDEFLRGFRRVSEAKARTGFFFDAVKRLNDFPEFVTSIESLVRPAEDEVEAFLKAFCRRAARLYCAHPDSRIAYVHALTLPVALSGLLPYFDEGADAGIKGEAALYVVQGVMALHAVYGECDGSEETAAERDAEVVELARSWDEIRYRAACSIQEHAIKMTEACLRADQMNPDPIFRIAAADSALRIEGGRNVSGC